MWQIQYLWAPAGLGIAHAPGLDEGTLAAAPVGSADGTNHELQHTFLDLDVVVTGLHERNGVFPALAAGEVVERSLIVKSGGGGSMRLAFARSGTCNSPNTEQLKSLGKFHEEGGRCRA